MKHLKTLGLAAMAVLALTAMVGVTSASAHVFRSTNAGAITTEKKTAHIFTVTGAEFTCNTISFSGNAVTSSETLSIHPEYSNCSAFGFIGATVNTAGCAFEFNANTNTMNLFGCTSHPPANNAAETGINIHISGCSTFIPNQNGINGITYKNTNTAPNRTLDIVTASTNIKVNVTETGLFGCNLTAGGRSTNGTYNGVTGVMVSGSAETWWE